MKKIPYLLFIVLVLVACQDKKASLVKTITELNQPDSLQTQENVVKLNKALNEYLIQYPGDEHEADYLYLAAQTCNETGQHQKALDQFVEFRQKFSNDKRAGDALFLIAFIQETKFNELDSAQKNYETFMIQYPNNALVPAAQASIATLGKSPEEIYNSFPKENIPPSEEEEE